VNRHTSYSSCKPPRRLGNCSVASITTMMNHGAVRGLHPAEAGVFTLAPPELVAFLSARRLVKRKRDSGRLMRILSCIYRWGKSILSRHVSDRRTKQQVQCQDLQDCSRLCQSVKFYHKGSQKSKDPRMCKRCPHEPRARAAFPAHPASVLGSDRAKYLMARRLATKKGACRGLEC